MQGSVCSCSKPGSDALLECSYTDEFVKSIMCIRPHIVLENGDVVPIQRRRALIPIKGVMLEPNTVGTRAKNSINTICTAERAKIPAKTDRIIAVKSYHVGPRLEVPLTDLFRLKCLSIESITINIPAGETFHVRITNH